MEDLDPSRLNYLIHHVFLPPELPQQDDSSPAMENVLAKYCLSALKSLQDLLDEPGSPFWKSCINMVDKLVRLRGNSGVLPSKELGKELVSLGHTDVLTLHIRGQNAGLIVRRIRKEYCFESFELSPTNEAVIGTAGRLRRSFPGPAIAIAADRVINPSFYKPFLEFLIRTDLETPSQVQPFSVKAQSRSNEIRDTVDPRLVTEMLTGILRAVGKPVEVPRIWKNTRDDVLWSDALLPWRRSPLWLLLRVAIQTTILQQDPVAAYIRYKSFLLHFMARVLCDALKASISSDLLYSMSAKLSRRALKLDGYDSFPGMSFLRDTLSNVRKELWRRWNPLPDRHKPTEPSNISFVDDTVLTIPGLRAYMREMASQPKTTINTQRFQPSCFPRLTRSSNALPRLERHRMEDVDWAYLALADIEMWVGDFLQDWTAATVTDPKGYTQLADLIETYAELAQANYSGRPEEMSLMFLTILELWIALDKCSIAQVGLLQDFDPGFPKTLFHSLLLPKKEHLVRLHSADQYLASRRARATSKSCHAFELFAHPESLGVRYFDRSPKHRQLRAKIEAEAALAKSKKLSEYAAKRGQYDNLIREATSKVCQYEKWYNYRGQEQTVHSASCNKCSLENAARDINIAIHEHPLPTEELFAKAAVFELDVPDVIYTWRIATFKLLADIFSARSRDTDKGDQKLYFLHSYTGLQNYFVSKRGRIQIASVAKPWVVTHYASKKISEITEEYVCVKNGLHYKIYDSETSHWTEGMIEKCDLRASCTFLLPDPYRRLQYAITGTGHTSNEVIAGQDACPQDFTVHEFYAFATLRAGHRLQWRNIARELCSRNLNFGREETLMLVIQSIWQAGPLGNGTIYRGTHVDLVKEDFALSLVSSIDEALRTIEGSWQGATAARIFTSLAIRLLSCSPHDTVRRGCFRLLERVREIALSWTRELSARMQLDNGSGELGKLNERILETALTCHGTFDVDEPHLSTLWGTNGSVEAIIECSIMIHDQCPASQTGLPAFITNLLRRFRRISHTVERSLRVHILTAQHLQDGLSSAISRLWAAFRPNGPWEALEEPCGRWLKTETLGQSGVPMLVHYNLLDGSLLLNGCPVSRLPRRYESHANYKRLLENKVIDAIPSVMLGMDFGSRSPIHGNQVHFGFRGSELIIRAIKDDRTYELIPQIALQNDFPHAFVNDYVHWRDLETGVLEWRPISDPWVPSLQNWRMLLRDKVPAVLSHGNLRAVDIRSRSADFITSALQPLELAMFVHITLDLDTSEIRIHLPRLKLDFFIRKHSLQLESKQFRGMAVDENQALGTMEGLVDRVVLRGLNNSLRSVIIPYGKVNFAKSDHRMRVRIEKPPTDKRIAYHYFQVDSQLGRLVETGSFTSKLYKSYLHAITSHCLKDSLTGRTGTEEAIWTLQGAASLSFLRLDQADIEILLLIGRLTPRRQYYPKYLKVMQQIEWNTHLSPLSQHELFCKIATLILQQAHDLEMFQECSSKLPDVDAIGEQHLLLKATIRNSTYRVHGFGAEDSTTEYDQVYSARDSVLNSAREYETSCTAKLIDQWSPNLACTSDLLAGLEGWRIPLERQKFEKVLPLGYNKTWLESTSTFLPKYWFTIQGALLQSTPATDKYRIMFLLCTIAYAGSTERTLVQTLLAFATVPELRALKVPGFPKFILSHGYEPQTESLRISIGQFSKEFEACPEKHLPLLPRESSNSANRRRREVFSRAVRQRIDTLATHLISQWPTKHIVTPTGTDCGTYIRLDNAMEHAKVQFESWHSNSELKKYMTEVQTVLNGVMADDPNIEFYSFLRPPYSHQPKKTHITFEDITSGQAPVLPQANFIDLDRCIGPNQQKAKINTGVKALLEAISKNFIGGFESQYTDDLQRSFHATSADRPFKLTASLESLRPLLALYRQEASAHVNDIYQELCRHLQKTSAVPGIACSMDMWPRLSPTALLHNLASFKAKNLRNDWKHALVNYGIAITILQRAERLTLRIGDEVELLSELINPGHEAWDPSLLPEWLLLEIENNMLIRPVQAQIASEMISPSSGSNSIVQLNMGEGKSSVIVPIVAATLADGKTLVRVVVLKPLSLQMYRLLAVRLGGLLNRRIFYMPFSRDLQLSTRQINKVRAMYEKCMETGGVLLVQPEHILSFELMGPERLISGHGEMGNGLVKIQQWLNKNSRDILDESDEILSVKFELVYTMGLQRAIDFSPDRWLIVEHVLELVGKYVQTVHNSFPEGLEIYYTSPGSFPRIRILQSAAGKQLLYMVAREICDAGLPGIALCYLQESVRDSLFRFLTNKITYEADAMVLQKVFSVPTVKKSLLLLHGLIAGGILQFALQSKRWRVNYGLDLSRSMLAVPYRAKDIPSTRSEFSHPDVAIVLTCLSYYHGGLSDDQLFLSFKALGQTDHAQEEYVLWIHDAPMVPAEFRQLSGINLSDQRQCIREIFPSLRFAKGVIDFYMSRIVFPKEMREFPDKISSSGWNIAKYKDRTTTGFSGTNDSRYLLPLSILQCDLEGQLHTNATQLDCLLRPENSFQSLLESSSETLSARSLLEIVVRSRPAIHVILDVGAQVLELQNKDLAMTWLVQVPDSEAQAVVFFDNNNELSVLTRDGATESLAFSPFALQMDQCLVYLDEAHTRGTDLKLPTNYRAAVTLGPNITKDRFVQACMRMRKLGKGQSIMICAPKDIERKILECSRKSPEDPIEVGDVIKWSIFETFSHTRKSIPLWATQGLRYQRQHPFWSEATAGHDWQQSMGVAKILVEPEAQTLEHRYSSDTIHAEDQVLLHGVEEIALIDRQCEVEAISARCKEFMVQSFNMASLHEEQERELSPENEQEVQVEKPPAQEPLKHVVHADLFHFVMYGKLRRFSSAFQPAFASLSSTSASKALETAAWPATLLVTLDFARTVKVPAGERLDWYVRPVHWIASRTENGRGDYVILSPFEANELLPSIRKRKLVRLHTYAPRTSQLMSTMEDLTTFAIPPASHEWIMSPIGMHLNLFAGQVYIRDYNECVALCRFLGLAFRPPEGQARANGDGFVEPSSRPVFDSEMVMKCPFTSSPVPFLQLLMVMRRKGQSYARSHLGKILRGGLLKEADFGDVLGGEQMVDAMDLD